MDQDRDAESRAKLIADVGKLVVVVALAALYGCASVGVNPAGSVVAIAGVTIVDPSSALPPAQNQTILVSGGVVRAIGSPAAIAVPAGARRLDARGKFAIPGLWDAHVHFMNTGPTALPLYIANGVTSVREMGGYIDSTRAWQARMKAGSIVGPRIVTPGPILESTVYLDRVVQRSVADPRIGRRVLPYRIGVVDSAHASTVIDSLVRLRVDFVKSAHRATLPPSMRFCARQSALACASPRTSPPPFPFVAHSIRARPISSTVSCRRSARSPPKRAIPSTGSSSTTRRGIRRP